MATYYTKCGREFNKSSSATVTGYQIAELLNDTHKIMDLKCQICPFPVEIKEGFPERVHKRWECRAGSKPPLDKTEWTGSLDDKNTIQIHSLNHELLEEIRLFCTDHSELGASYNADHLADCRRTLSICCSSNKKGIAAKKAVISKFFPADSITAGNSNDDREDRCCFLDEDPQSEDFNFDVATAINLHSCKDDKVLNFYKDIVEDDTNTDELSCNDSLPYKAKCPYLSTIGDKYINCTLHFRFKDKHEFSSQNEVLNYSSNFCFCDFDKCDTYQKIYQEQMNNTDKNRECAFCCNNSGYTGLSDCKKGNTHGFCQVHKKDVEKFNPDVVCKWFNKFYRPDDAIFIETEKGSTAEPLPYCHYFGGASQEGKKHKLKCGNNYLLFDDENALSEKNKYCMNTYRDCRAYTRREIDRLNIDLGSASPQKTEHLINLLNVAQSEYQCCPNCSNLGAYIDDGYSEEDGTFKWSCKLGQQDAASDNVCNNYKRNEGIKMISSVNTTKKPRNIVSGVCEKMKEDCICFCDHNDGCSIRLIKGNALPNYIKTLAEDGGIDCDIYRDASEKILKNTVEQQDVKDISNITLDENLLFIKSKSKDIVNNYILIGFTLINIKENRLFTDNGYSSLIECVEEELNMKKSTCYNLIKIAENFGNPETKQLKDDFKQFNYVQCLEMSTMPISDRQLVTPDMSKREIQQLKNSNRLEKENSRPVEQNEITDEIVEVTNYTVVDAEADEPVPVENITEDSVYDLDDSLDELENERQDDNLILPEEGHSKFVLDIYNELEKAQSKVRDLEKEKKVLWELIHEIDSKINSLSKTQIKNALWNFIASGEINFDG